MNNSSRQWKVLVFAIFLSVFIGFLDMLSGFELSLFVFYFIPIYLVSNELDIKFAIFQAVFSALCWGFADHSSGHVYSSHFFLLWNTMMRLVSFLVIALVFNKVKSDYENEHLSRLSLQKALSEVKVLEAFLSICAVCKKIRNEKGDYEQMESYISKKTNALFSHGYCPECAKKLLEDSGLNTKIIQ